MASLYLHLTFLPQNTLIVAPLFHFHPLGIWLIFSCLLKFCYWVKSYGRFERWVLDFVERISSWLVAHENSLKDGDKSLNFQRCAWKWTEGEQSEYELSSPHRPQLTQKPLVRWTWYQLVVRKSKLSSEAFFIRPSRQSAKSEVDGHWPLLKTNCLLETVSKCANVYKAVQCHRLRCNLGAGVDGCWRWSSWNRVGLLQSVGNFLHSVYEISAVEFVYALCSRVIDGRRW